MRVRDEELKLDELTERYEIIGEGEARGGARPLIGRRRDDSREIEILLVGAPEGAHPNALTLFAADVRTLSTLEHRSMTPILEHRWVAPETLAVVVERVPWKTLAEVIESGDALTFPRIASILRDVHGFLDWARDHRVVHRVARPENVFVEPETDSIRILPAVDPVPMDGGVPAADDARMIASLAWLMVTRGRALPVDGSPSIGEIRPTLPSRLVDEMDSLLAPAGQRAAPPEVSGFIATVGMADVLQRGEVEAAHSQALLMEEARRLREHWEAENRACHNWAEQQAREFAEEREHLQLETAALRERLQSEAEEESARLNREFSEEREKLENRFAEDRARLEGEIEAQRREIAELRADLEREIAEAREQIARERAEHDAFVEDERRQVEIERAQLDLLIAAAPEQPIEGSEAERSIVATALPFTPAMLDALAEEHERDHPAAVDRPRNRERSATRWIATGGAVLVLAAAAGGAALMLGRTDRDDERRAQQEIEAATLASPQSLPASVIDSIAGAVQPDEWESGASPPDAGWSTGAGVDAARLPETSTPRTGTTGGTSSGTGAAGGTGAPAAGSATAPANVNAAGTSPAGAMSPATGQSVEPTTTQRPPQQTQPQSGQLPQTQSPAVTQPSQEPAVTPQLPAVPVVPPPSITVPPPTSDRQPPVRNDTARARVLNPPDRVDSLR